MPLFSRVRPEKNGRSSGAFRPDRGASGKLQVARDLLVLNCSLQVKRVPLSGTFVPSAILAFSVRSKQLWYRLGT